MSARPTGSKFAGHPGATPGTIEVLEPSGERCVRKPRAIAIELPASAGRPIKRSFSIRGHRTSISLETPFWEALIALAAEREMPVAGLVAAIDAARGTSSLSSAIRVVILEHYLRETRDRCQN